MRLRTRRAMALPFVASVVVATLAAGCRGDGPRPGPDEGVPRGTVVPAPDPDPVLPDPFPPVEPRPLEPPELPGVAADTVRGWTGPGGLPFEVALRTSGAAAHLHRQIGLRTFALPARTSELTLTQYPCASCHEGVEATGPQEAAHPEIHVVHPAAGADCATCHLPAAVDHLLVARSEPVGLDHAYQLCAQCHFQQTRSWAAGVHGKRLEGWAGRRVVMNCTDCHNPHAPAIESRIPFPGPRFP